MKENENKNQEETATKYNRKNVDKIKKLIIAVFVVMFALPILICIFLMIKISSMERRLDELSNHSHSNAVVETVSDKKINNYEKQDMTSYDYIDTQQSITENLALGNLTVASEEDADFDKEENKATASDADMTENDNEALEDDKEYSLNGKKVYLTFDDGPSIYTDEILDILEENNVKATFFVVHYDNEDLWPAYQRIVYDGHTLAMHSYTHIYREIYKDEDSFKKDVDDLHDFLYDLTGYDCKYYRFPGGSSNHVSNVDIQLCMKYLDECGITYFDWNSLSGDAEGGYHTASDLDANILKYVRSNEGDSIVLMHDLSDRHSTVEGLQYLIDTLKEEGYEICAIDENTPLIQHVKYDPDLIGED